MKATFFDTSTGQITKVCTVRDVATADLNVAAGESWIEGDVDARTHYIADPAGTPTTTERPTYPEPVEAPAGTWTWTNCPAGMEVAVWDVELAAVIAAVSETDGTIEITLVDPGSYQLRAGGFPYIEQRTEVEIA